MLETKISLTKLTKVFGKNPNRVIALKNINLEIKDRKFTTVVGPSGCGKSTLLSLIAGFDHPSSGEIRLNGSVIKKPGPDRGFVFQDYALFPWKTVLGNIMFGMLNVGIKKKAAKAKAMDYIKLVHLEGFEHAYPHTLSGGMKQRVGLARTLAYDPEVLLMDEPFGALDAQTKKYMQGELVRIWESFHKTVVFVTHSVIEAVFLSDSIVVMSARPGQVKGVIDVNIPRPRDYTSDRFLEIREQVLGLLEEEVRKQVISNEQPTTAH